MPRNLFDALVDLPDLPSAHPVAGRSRIKGLRAAQRLTILLHTRFEKYALHRKATAEELAICARACERLKAILEDLKPLHLRADRVERLTVRKRKPVARPMPEIP